MKKEKLGVGIVGSGWVSGEHILAFNRNPKAGVVAVCGRTRESAQRKLREVGVDARIYEKYDDMLADREVDVISICTPNNLHAQETIRAAKAGKHVLIEKPVCLNLKDLKEMRDVVRKAKVKTLVSFVLHWNPLFTIIKSQLKEKTIGKIFYAEVDYYHGIGPWYKQYAWNIKKNIGGNSLLSAGCHAVDGLRWFVGSNVREVFSYSTRSNSKTFEYEYDPTSVTILTFANGVVGKVTSCLENVSPYMFNILLLGDEGTIRNNQLYTKKMPGQKNFAVIPTILPDSGDVTHHPFQGEVDHLIDCILTNRESHVNLEDAVNTHEVCIAAEMSAKTKKPVKLPLL